MAGYVDNIYYLPQIFISVSDSRGYIHDFLPSGSCARDPVYSGSCMKDASCWSHDCLVSMTMSPIHCDVT